MVSWVSAAEYEAFMAPLVDAPQAIRAMHNLPRGNPKCAHPCATMGYSNMGPPVCCPKNAVCALDQVGNVACCPDNSVCTGTIAASNGPTGGAAAATSTTEAPTGAPSASISHAISGTSMVPNSYYPYPVLPTAYTGADDCSASYTACQAESAKCTGFIEGGGYGVTVGGDDGIITQQAALGPSSAEAICSSLSQEACHGLDVSMCSTLGGAAKATAAAGSFVVGSQTSNGGAVPTRRAMMYGLGFGMAVGIAGQVAG